MFASIIIPTIGRSESLRDCLESLWTQDCQDYEIIRVTENGELAALRNKGAKQAKGEILIFIDDDVICGRLWLSAIMRTFGERKVAGVSGPAIIRPEFRRNRDIFKYQLIHNFFTRGSKLPGHISKTGAWTTGACEPSCSYEGPVQFLEACNMAFRTSIFNEFGGFDESYHGIGDWSEPDLCFRMHRAGYNLWFSRDARLEHRPSTAGAFKKRNADSNNRLANYELFSKRWIRPCWEHSLYKWVLRQYYATKTAK